MTVSIIIPVLNEAVIIRKFLTDLRASVGDAEVIIVDGGSSDGTLEHCHGLVNRVLQTAQGRARQMNVGAQVAAGDVLWFIHADSNVNPGSLAAIERALAIPSVVGGCFRLEIVPARWVYRIRDAVGNSCVTLFRIALGDRGFFCRREIFVAVGGYPDQPLLEDADFYKKIRRLGRVQQLPLKIQTSARRYEALGPVRTSLFYLLIMTLYLAGTKMSVLQRMVGWFSRTVAKRQNQAIKPRSIIEYQGVIQ